MTNGSGIFIWGSMKDLVSIKFNNWEKYNPRKDLKRPWWFAFSNDFATNQNFDGFTNTERLVFVYLLCECSLQTRSGHATFTLRTKSRQWSIRSHIIKSTIKKLFLYGICTESVPTEQNNTEQNNTKEKIFKKESENLGDNFKNPKGKVINNQINQEIKPEISREEISLLKNTMRNFARPIDD